MGQLSNVVATGVAIAALAIGAAGCGAGSRTAAVTDGSGGLIRGEAPGDAPHPFNWSHPNPEGIDVPSSAWDNPAAIRDLGRMTFTPIVPHFGQSPAVVEVDSSGGGVIFVYDFPLGSDFPSDGHVRVSEFLGMSAADVPNFVASREKVFPGEISLIKIGNGIPVALGHRDGQGVAGLSLNGNVWVQIVGQALSPATAQKLAEAFG